MITFFMELVLIAVLPPSNRIIYQPNTTNTMDEVRLYNSYVNLGHHVISV